jgi:hypothetical protein
MTLLTYDVLGTPILSLRGILLRLSLYAIVGVTTGFMFVGGAAFYSFVWPAPTPPVQSLELFRVLPPAQPDDNSSPVTPNTQNTVPIADGTQPGAVAPATAPPSTLAAPEPTIPSAAGTNSLAAGPPAAVAIAPETTGSISAYADTSPTHVRKTVKKCVSQRQRFWKNGRLKTRRVRVCH